MAGSLFEVIQQFELHDLGPLDEARGELRVELLRHDAVYGRVRVELDGGEHLRLDVRREVQGPDVVHHHAADLAPLQRLENLVRVVED